MNKNGLSMLTLLVLFLMGSCTGTSSSPESGQNLSVTKGCAACHAVDDTPKIGPSWVGLYESQVELADGSSVTADEAYLIESTLDPNAKIVSGYAEGSMPAIPLTDEELNAIVVYIKSVK
jgi:cytochrome c1